MQSNHQKHRAAIDAMNAAAERKHTQGPWVADGDQVEVQAEFNDGYRICDVFGPDYKANARLIAASPDMLEALRLASQSAGFQYMTHETRLKIDNAIAKAAARSNSTGGSEDE
jgi:hypothetical protein